MSCQLVDSRRKLLGAYGAGMSTVILPEKNRKDTQELPEELTKNLKLEFVDNIVQVFELALEKKKTKAYEQKEADPRGRQEEENSQVVTFDNDTAAADVYLRRFFVAALVHGTYTNHGNGVSGTFDETSPVALRRIQGGVESFSLSSHLVVYGSLPFAERNRAPEILAPCCHAIGGIRCLPLTFVGKLVSLPPLVLFLI